MNKELAYKLVKNNDEIHSFYLLADKVWHEYFPCILEKEQIDYMVEMFFSKDAMDKQINSSYEFYFVQKDNENIGFIVVHPEEEKLFLSKLYLTLENRGKGYASKMMNFVIARAKELKKKSVYLTVNKYNKHTIDVYNHCGYKTIRSEQTDIGKGYIMDDYVMELTL